MYGGKILTNLIPLEVITDRIFNIRNQKVMIDYDLANLYAVPTKAVNQAVKRNNERFPSDFMFQLNRQERNELVTNCDRLKNLKYSSSMPFAFTESGVSMLSSVLNSERAIKINIQIIRAFIRLRKILEENIALRYAFEGLEKKMNENERDIELAIRGVQHLFKTSKLKELKQ